MDRARRTRLKRRALPSLFAALCLNAAACLAALRKRIAAIDAVLATRGAAKTTPSGSALHAELMRRFALDQKIRELLLESPPADFPPGASLAWGAVFGIRWAAIDCDNTRWLKQQLETIGWFDIPTYGAAGSAGGPHLRAAHRLSVGSRGGPGWQAAALWHPRQVSAGRAVAAVSRRGPRATRPAAPGPGNEAHRRTRREHQPGAVRAAAVMRR